MMGKEKQARLKIRGIFFCMRLMRLRQKYFNKCETKQIHSDARKNAFENYFSKAFFYGLTISEIEIAFTLVAAEGIEPPTSRV